MRRIVTAADVQDAHMQGRDHLEVTPETVVTDEARDCAVRMGICFIDAQEDTVEEVTVDVDGTLDEDPDRGSATDEILCIETRSDVIITGGEILLPGQDIVRADVVIDDGRVIALCQGASSDGLQVDAAGLLVAPGLFDPHVHIGLLSSPGEELATEGNAALLGGICTLGWFIGGEGSHLGMLDGLEGLVSAHSGVDIVPHLVIGDRTQLQEIPEYYERGVRSFKLYMCGIPGLIESVDDGFIMDVFEALSPYKDEVLLCIHAENASVVDRALARNELDGDYDAVSWSETPPALAEEEAIIRGELLGRQFGVRTYFVHVSSREGLEAVRRVRREGGGGRIFAETTSPYLAAPLSASVSEKMVPPLRDRQTADALWRGLDEGVLQVVGTDNVTMTAEEKGLGGPADAVMPGYPALGTHLPLLLHEGYHRRSADLMKVMTAVTRGPAEIFGVYPRKGTLLPGSDADCVVIDLDEKRRVEPQRLGSRSDFALAQGRTLHGWPVMTMKGGAIAALNGSRHGKSQGRVILRKSRSEGRTGRERD